MASSSIISEKERSIIKGLKAELLADSSVPKEVPSNHVITRANMMNNGVANMHLHDINIWSGSTDGAIPDTIEWHKSGSFTHRATTPGDTEGSTGAVVYVGPKYEDGPDECAWVMAWSVLGDGSVNKIYVETGPSSKYPKGRIIWSKIKANLQKSDSYSPPNHGAEASASLDASGNTPIAGVTFNVNLDE